MSPFDFLFALFSLLLGLAMAEILQGFGQVMKFHARARAGLERRVRVGVLVPLLALYVLLSQLFFWTQTYRIQERLPFNYLTLLVVTAIVGGYYLLSVLVWPDELDDWPDFDAYYDQHNRLILSGNLTLTIAGAVITGIYSDPSTAPVVSTIVLAIEALGFGGALLLNFVVIFVRRRRLNAALLALLILLDVGGAIATVAAGIV